MERAIGGFFPLEFRMDVPLPFERALPVNLGRTGFELILRHRRYRRVRVPAYCCPVVFRTLQRCGVEWECYRIDGNLEPTGGTAPDGASIRDPYRPLAEDEAFLYVNYFGVKDRCVTELASYFPRFIADLTPSFFSMPPTCTEGVSDGFNSARKFFGVPDGAFLFAENAFDWDEAKSLPRQRTGDYCRSLLWRSEESYETEPGYLEFQRQESAMDQWPVAKMSRISEQILRSINLPQIAARRRHNFQWFHDRLCDRNTLHSALEQTKLFTGKTVMTNGVNLVECVNMADGVHTASNVKMGSESESQSINRYIAQNRICALNRDNTKNGCNASRFDRDVELPVPQYYPFLPAVKGTGAMWKRELCRNRVFVPTLWPDLESTLRQYCDDAVEWRLVQDLICLPITQHCSDDDLARILRLLSTFAH